MNRDCFTTTFFFLFVYFSNAFSSFSSNVKRRFCALKLKKTNARKLFTWRWNYQISFHFINGCIFFRNLVFFFEVLHFFSKPCSNLSMTEFLFFANHFLKRLSRKTKMAFACSHVVSWIKYLSEKSPLIKLIVVKNAISPLFEIVESEIAALIIDVFVRFENDCAFFLFLRTRFLKNVSVQFFIIVELKDEMNLRKWLCIFFIFAGTLFEKRQIYWYKIWFQNILLNQKSRRRLKCFQINDRCQKRALLNVQQLGIVEVSKYFNPTLNQF